MNRTSKKPQRQMVVLNFDEIDCKRLQLAGDFNNWIPDHDIETRNINGHWQKVFTAVPGVYEYRTSTESSWTENGNRTPPILPKFRMSSVASIRYCRFRYISNGLSAKPCMAAQSRFLRSPGKNQRPVSQ